MNIENLFNAKPLIHIGYPKCLSTWLQKKLFLEENGYSTALDPLESKISFIDPPPFKFNIETPLHFIKQKNIQSTNTVPVITAESLAGNLYCGGYDAQLNADRLYEALPNANILIIVREQQSLIRSLYKTQINWGMPHKIDELLLPPKHRLSPVFNLEYLKFDGLINYYINKFGKQRVLVLPYELFLEKPHLFIHRINHHAGVSKDIKQRYSAKQRINQNRPLIDIYFDRLKNTLTKTSFNYLGPFTESEIRINKRLATSKKVNRFPQFTKNWFEKEFSQKVADITRDQFEASNRITESLTGLSLKDYGYQ